MGIAQVLMARDGLTQRQADQEVQDGKAELWERLGNGEEPFDICEELFGLEPDFIMELMD